MKIGLLAWSTNTGLGYQTLDFAKNIKCSKILISDLSKHNGMQTHHTKFFNLGYCRITEIPNDEDIEWLTDDIDIIFVCETPLNYKLFEVARQKGVKTVLQYNYEFLQYLQDDTLPKPDVLASPSHWKIGEITHKGFAHTEYLPVPIDTSNIKYRSMTDGAKTFVHIIGRPAENDRNGTLQFIEAAEEIEEIFPNKFSYKVFLQSPKEARVIKYFQPTKERLFNLSDRLGSRFELIIDTESNIDMYKEGEVLVLPRKYGGLCLPLWEAMSAGMPVIMPDIDPNNKVLPNEWLVPAYSTGSFMARTLIDCYTAYTTDLAMKMISFAFPSWLEESNIKAKELADKKSWKNMKDQYLNLFRNLL